MSLCLGVVSPLLADEELDTPLAKEMDIVSGSLKKLRKAENNAAKAQLMRDAQAATIKSLEYLPDIFKEEKDKTKIAKMTADFKRLIGLSFSKLSELELAFLNEDEVAAEKILDELKDIKKTGHKAYMKEED